MVDNQSGVGAYAPGVKTLETEFEARNRIVKECLRDDAKRAKMNEAMAETIGREVYDHSLARVLLMPHIVKDGKCPAYSESGGAPVVVVHLVEEEERVLGCRAFRDSVREEESVRTVRDIEFLAVRGGGIRPSSFPLHNVFTLRWPDLNGDAFNRVAQARVRMRDSLAADETRVALRALAWVTARYGKVLWAGSMAGAEGAIEAAVVAVGTDNHPIIVCSKKSAIEAVEFFDLINDHVGFCIGDGSLMVPVHINDSIPDHAVYVVPSGKNLGEMPIFIQPTVKDYDKAERLIKGWQVFQDQGMIFTGGRRTRVVLVGWRGLVEAVKILARRLTSW